MKKLFKSIAASLLVMLITASAGFAQEALKPRPSPTAIATYKHDDAYVKITYGRPHKRDRTTFGGELAPYGQVWRTGANEATEITLTKDVTVSGQALKAGTYTVFTIPNEKEWIVIFNSELGQWGAYRYEESKDVLRVKASVTKIDEEYEPFTIAFEQKENQVMLMFIWDQTKVSLPVRF